jgi:hypothetical protein
MQRLAKRAAAVAAAAAAVAAAIRHAPTPCTDASGDDAANSSMSVSVATEVEDGTLKPASDRRCVCVR